MFGIKSARHSGAPVFVLATRLFVHYKFKTRKTFDPSATLVDDAYAREVLAAVRAVPDARLKELADTFELARFGKLTPAPAPAVRGPGELLDLSLDTPG
jgi:hypothetical protein